MKRIYTVIKGHVKSWFRSRSTIFWTIAFPILLILLFGAIFGGGSQKFDLYVQNQDLVVQGQNLVASPTSQAYVQVLNGSQAFDIFQVPAAEDGVSYMKVDGRLHNRGQRLLVVPQGFEDSLNRNESVSIRFYADQTDQASSTLTGIVFGMTNAFAASRQGTPPILVQTESIATRNIRYIDFFIPGVIGMTLLTSGVFGAVSTNGRYRELKIIKKLATTPLSKIEWILGMIGYQMFLAAISVAVILVVGRFAFNVTAVVDVYTVALVVAASLLFPGIGMVLANFVKDADGAEAAANAITFPMMFLSGTFWPRETMPDFLKTVAGFLPLTYVNDGLRDAMIYLDPAQALNNTIIALGLALGFVILGSVLMNWKEE